MLRVILCIVALFTFLECASASTIEYKGSRISALAPYLTILADPMKTLTLEDVASSIDLSSAHVDPQSAPSGSVYWMHFTLKNQIANQESMVLLFRYNFLEKVKLYILKNGQLNDLKLSGSAIEPAKRDMDNRYVAFQLALEGKEELDFYVRLESKANLNLSSELIPIKDFYNEQLQDYSLRSLYYGIFIALLIFNLFILFQTRDLTYLSYLFFLVSSGLYTSYADEYLIRFFWFSHEGLLQHSPAILIILGMIAGTLHSYHFLRIKDKVLKRTFYTILGVCLAFFILSFTNYFAHLYLIKDIFLWLVIVFIITVAYHRLRSGYTPAKYFLFAWLAYLIFTSIYVLAIYNKIPLNLYTSYSYHIGSSLEMILFSLAIGSRIKHLNEEKKQALKEASAYRTLRSVMARVSHDTLKPYSIMKIIISSILQEKDFNKAKEKLKKIEPTFQNIIRSASAMIENLNDIGRELSIKPQSTSIIEIIHECLNEKFSASNMQWRFIYEFNHQYLLYIDREKVKRIIGNIIGNAIEKTMCQESRLIHTLQFSTECISHDFVCIRIQNTGSSVSEDKLSSIFQLFFSSENDGRGIGLTIVKKFVRLHGGRSWASSSVNENTFTIHFTLPRGKCVDGRSKTDLPANSEEIKLFESK